MQNWQNLQTWLPIVGEIAGCPCCTGTCAPPHSMESLVPDHAAPMPCRTCRVNKIYPIWIFQTKQQSVHVAARCSKIWYTLPCNHIRTHNQSVAKTIRHCKAANCFKATIVLSPLVYVDQSELIGCFRENSAPDGTSKEALANADQLSYSAHVRRQRLPQTHVRVPVYVLRLHVDGCHLQETEDAAVRLWFHVFCVMHKLPILLNRVPIVVLDFSPRGFQKKFFIISLTF